jgi:pyruvate kinase
MRLNFSHATEEEVELRVKNLKLCEGRHSVSLGHTDHKNVRAILLDTRGPEIRMGKLKNDFSGHETISMDFGSTVTLHTTAQWEDSGSTEVSFVMHNFFRITWLHAVFDFYSLFCFDAPCNVDRSLH